MLHDRLQTFLVLRPVLLGYEAPPASGQAVAHQSAGLRPAAGLLVFAGQPEKALGAQQTTVAPFLREEIEEALRMERPARTVSTGGDAVFLGFRHVLATQFLEPTRCLRGAVEVEAAGVEDLVQGDLPHAHGLDVGVGVEPAQDGHQLLALGLADQVNLADEDHVGELHLLDQQVGDRAFVLLAQGFATAGQAVGLMEIAQEVHPVDHRDHGVQPRQVGQAASLLIAEGEGLGHRQRLADAGGLDQQVVEAAVAGQAADLVEQVFAQGAADAAVAHFHQLLFGAVEADVLLDGGTVDVDLAHVVDDHRDLAAFAVLQHMVEQGALAGAEKAGQHGNG